MSVTYEYYEGDQDPSLLSHEVECVEDAENFNAVECENGCGFWRGDLLDEDQCPECGGETHNLADDYFDED